MYLYRDTLHKELRTAPNFHFFLVAFFLVFRKDSIRPEIFDFLSTFKQTQRKESTLRCDNGFAVAGKGKVFKVSQINCYEIY